MEIRPILSALLKNSTAPFLVALQVAISLAILSNALYIVEDRLARAERPSGVSHEEEIVRITVDTVKQHKFIELLPLQQRIRQLLQAVPGVTAVGSLNQLPMTRNGSMTSIAADRKQSKPSATASSYSTMDSAIRILGLKLVQGRDFRPEEILASDPEQNGSSPRQVILSQAMAKALYPGVDNVVGKPMYFGVGDDADQAQIIGVVEHLQTIRADVDHTAEYSIITASNNGDTDFVIRTAPGQRERVIKDAEASLRKGLGESVIVNSRTLERARVERYQNDRTLAFMLLSVSAFLLLITASGTVGMSMLWVAQRRKQIGVRRALGARKIDILRYFVTENVLINASGIALGGILALALNQILVSKLGMLKLPPAFIACGALLFILIGVLSVLGPALRAASISPAMATRSV